MFTLKFKNIYLTLFFVTTKLVETIFLIDKYLGILVGE